MKTHLASVIQGLVAVAHRDPEAYLALSEIAEEVWALDMRAATAADDYWSEPDDAIGKLADLKSDAETLEVGLPRQIADVLGGQQEEGACRRVNIPGACEEPGAATLARVDRCSCAKPQG
jgi:hypothetical protein